MKKIISTDRAPAAIGPYSQAITLGGLIITSGQLPLDPATGAFPEGIQAQPVPDQCQGDLGGSGKRHGQGRQDDCFSQRYE